MIVPERLDTPTSADLKLLADEYRRLRGELRGAEQLTPASLVTRTRMAEFVETRLADLLPADLAAAARTADPPLSVAEHLEKRARYAAQGIDLGPELNGRLEALGYKPVVTSGEVLFTTDQAALGKLVDVGDYTRQGRVLRDDRPRLAEGLRRLDLPARRGPSRLRARSGHGRGRGSCRRQGARGAVPQARPGGASRPVRGPLQFTDTAGLPRHPPARRWTYATSPSTTSSRRSRTCRGSPTRPPWRCTARSAARPRTAGRLRSGPRWTPCAHSATRCGSTASGLRRLHADGEDPQPRPARPLGALAGAGLGAAAGDEGLEDILKGAAGGLVLGLGARAYAKGAYGYLPDRLVKLNTALRYSLSFAFDAGRYTEASSTMMARYGLPGVFRPRRYIASRGPLRSPYSEVSCRR